MSLDINLMLDDECVWSRNITHNVNVIAKKAGFYDCIWRPEGINVIYARDNIKNLQLALSEFYKYYDELIKLNPSNGWGTLDGLIEFTADYLKACIEYPNAKIEVDR